MFFRVQRKNRVRGAALAHASMRMDNSVTPHPPLRGTFSLKGRRKDGTHPRSAAIHLRLVRHSLRRTANLAWSAQGTRRANLVEHVYVPPTGAAPRRTGPFIPPLLIVPFLV